MPKERRHAAIVFTDIVGYTALMGSDEDKAFEILSKNRGIHTQLIQKYNGTLIKEMGDGMLIRFDLASDAVYCGLEIQRKCKEQDIPLKIGIHEGEMVIEGADVLGHAVNVASRLESETHEGCIYISGSVYRDVKNRSDIHTKYIKEKRFKNVDEPIKVYEVLCDQHIDNSNSNNTTASKTFTKKYLIFTIGIIVISISGIILWLTFHNKQVIDDEKTIAVLPLINQSESDEYAYFGDALTDEIIQNLQKIKEFKVRSYTSVMKYKDSDKSASEIGDELKVNYVLEGRAQRYQDKIRISVQLIHAKNDEHLWGDIYDKQWGDIFQLQSDLSKDISNELVTALTPQEEESIEEIPTDNLEAYEYYLKAKEFHNQYSASSNKSLLSNAILLYNKAVKLDPNFALAYVHLGSARFSQTYWDDYFKENFGDSLLWYTNKALEINPKLSDALTVKGWYYVYNGERDSAIVEFNNAIAINPNIAESYRGLGYCYLYQGDQEKGFENYLKAKELLVGDQSYPYLLDNLGRAFHNICDVENCRKMYEELVNYDPFLGYRRLFWLACSIMDIDKIEYYTNQVCSIDSGRFCFDALQFLYLQKDDIEKSWKYRLLFRQEIKKRGEINLNQTHRDGYLLWIMGRKEEAMYFFDKQIEYCEESIQLKRPYATAGSAYYDLAGIYAFLGQREKAYEFLHQFFEEFSAGWLLLNIQHDPIFDSIRDEEEYETIIQRQEKKYADIRLEIDKLLKEEDFSI